MTNEDLMKRVYNNLSIFLSFLSLFSFPMQTLGTNNWNPFYKCLDQLVTAEQFYYDLNEAPYMSKKFKYTEFDGKKLLWIQVLTILCRREMIPYLGRYECINLYKGKIPHVSESLNKKLLNKWNEEFGLSKEELKERTALAQSTDPFDESHGGSLLIYERKKQERIKEIYDSSGYEFIQEKKDPPRSPYALLATRAKEDGQYLYILTNDGPRLLKVSDNASKRYYVAMRRLLDPPPTEDDPFPVMIEIKLDGTNVKHTWSTSDEIKAAGITYFDSYEKPEKYANKLGMKFVVLDSKQLNINSEITKDTESVFTEELQKIYKKITESHANQMEYLTKLDEHQKKLLMEYSGHTPAEMANNYTKKYTSALQFCADRRVAMSDALDTIDNLNKNLHRKFPAKDTGDTQQRIKFENM